MFQLSYIDKVTIKVILFTIVTVISIPYYFYAGGTLLGFIVVRLIAYVINGFAILGWHRWLCHNSFKAHKPGTWLMLFGMVLAGYGKPLHLVIAHRLHHVHSDTDLDPHSPKNMSFLNMWLGRYNISTGIRVPKDFFKNKEAVFVNNHYWKLYILFNVTFALIDLKTALIFCPFTFIWGWTLNNIILNYFGHKNNGNIGPHNINMFVTNFVFGEGLHKAHHDNPSKYDLTTDEHYDIGGTIIRKFLLAKET